MEKFVHDKSAASPPPCRQAHAAAPALAALGPVSRHAGLRMRLAARRRCGRACGGFGGKHFPNDGVYTEASKSGGAGASVR